MPRWVRITLIAVTGPVTLLVALLGALQVPAISTWTVNQLAGLAPLAPGWRLDVGRAEGDWLTRLRLTDITLHHDSALVARIGSLEARYGPFTLAIGLPVVDAVLVDDVEVTATRGPGGWDLATALRRDTTPPAGESAEGGFGLDTLSVTNVRVRARLAPDSGYTLSDFILQAHDIRTGQVTTAVLDTIGGTAEPPTGGPVRFAARGALAPERLELPLLLVTGPRTRIAGSANVPLGWNEPARMTHLQVNLRADPLDLTEVAAWTPAVQPGNDMYLDLRAIGRDGKAAVTFDGKLGEGTITTEALIAPPRGGALDISVDGSVSAFDPSLLVAAAPPSVVQGTFAAGLAGPALERVSGRVDVDLTALRLATTDVDFIRLRAPFDDGRSEFTLEAELLEGRAEARGWVRPFDERPSFDLTASARGFPQLEPLAGPLGVPGHALTIAIAVAGDGADLAGLRARGRVDLAGTDSTGRQGIVGAVPFEVADGRLSARPDLPLLGGRVNGLVEAGLAARPVSARARLALVGIETGVRVDSMSLDATWRDGEADLAVDARFPGNGRLTLEGRAELGGEVPALSGLRGEFSGLDLGAILPRDSLTTDLNGTLTGSAAGRDLVTAQAQAVLLLNPSTINQASIQQGEGRVELANGAFDLTLDASGPNGMLDLAASGTLLDPERTVHAEGPIGVRDLDRWAGRKMLAGHLDGVFEFDGALDSAGVRRADAILSARGQVGEVVVDSVHVAIRSNGRTSLSVDTVLIESNAVSASGGGVIALREGPDTTAFHLVGSLLDGTSVAATLGRNDVVIDTTTFEVHAAGPATATRVAGTAAIVNLIYGTSQVRNLAGGAELLLDEGRLRAVAGSLSVPAAVLAGVPARDLSVIIRHDSVVVAEARGVLGRELALEARFTGVQRADSVMGTVEALSLENPVRRWELERPARVHVRPTVRVDSLILRSGTDRWISLDGTIDPQGPNDLTLAFEGLTLDMYRGSGLEWLNGELDGSVRYGGTATAPTAEGQLRWAVTGRGDEPAGVIASDFAWEPAGVRLDARVEHADGSALTAEGWLPAAMWAANPGEAGAADTVGLAIRSDGLNLQLLEALTPPDMVKTLAGQLMLDARLAGRVGQPAASGTVRLVEASGEFPAVGVKYEEIGLEASLEGEAFRLTELRLVTGEGRMIATGQATLAPLSNPGFDFEARFDRFILAQNPLLRSRVDSGAVRMSGTLEEPVLEGRVVLGRTDAYADGGGAATNAESVELSEADLEKLARDFGPSVLVREDEGTLLQRFRIDLAVSMPGGVWVRRRREPKVDIEVRGAIKVVQEPGGEMQFRGSVNPVPGRGYINLYGKNFRLTGGEVKLEGPVEATKVEVVAEYEVANKGGIDSEPILITVETRGTLDTLDVSFSSSPQMAQDDILSYLITGRPASDNVIASSNGGSVGTDLAVGGLAEGFSSAAGQAVGLDVFQIKPDGLRGLTMVAGQYVMPDLFLSMEQPVQVKTDAETDAAVGPSFEVEYGINSWLRSTVRAGSKPFALFLKGRRAY